MQNVCVCVFAAVQDLTGIIIDLFHSCWKNRHVKHIMQCLEAYATLSLAHMTNTDITKLIKSTNQQLC